MTNPADIARALSEAQKAYLTTKAKWRMPYPGARERWMTWPPSSTHRVLKYRGLVDGVGQISNLGLAVRDHLLNCPTASDASTDRTPATVDGCGKGIE